MCAEYVLLICAVVCYFVSLICGVLFCETGYFGYPDVWKNTAAEKIYIAAGVLSMILMIVALFVCFF